MLRAAFALFGAGIASFLAPCVLPLVPVYLGVVGASSGDRRGPLRSTLVFVAGFSVVFVAFGGVLGAIGAALNGWRGPLQFAGGVAVIVFGVALVVPRLVPRLARTVRLTIPLPSSALARPAVVGVTFALAWTPCVGPLLGAALVTAAGTGASWRGAVLLGAYACGLGLPFVVASVGIVSSERLRRLNGRVAVAIARAGGVVLVIAGVALVAGRYGTLVSALARLRR